MRAVCRKCNTDLEITEDNGFVVSECDKCGGNHGFIAGIKGLSVDGDNVTCNCHNPVLELELHMHMKTRSIHKYKCKTCGNSIEMQ